ncbi:hypothetical protein PC122_g2533 [Phytophthora cactorum]|nr:hypothetical protein PC122_g2533 [Phytophthora cactorum]
MRFPVLTLIQGKKLANRFCGGVGGVLACEAVECSGYEVPCQRSSVSTQRQPLGGGSTNERDGVRGRSGSVSCSLWSSPDQFSVGTSYNKTLVLMDSCRRYAPAALHSVAVALQACDSGSVKAVSVAIPALIDEFTLFCCQAFENGYGMRDRDMEGDE